MLAEFSSDQFRSKLGSNLLGLLVALEVLLVLGVDVRLESEWNGIERNGCSG